MKTFSKGNKIGLVLSKDEAMYIASLVGGTQIDAGHVMVENHRMHYKKAKFHNKAVNVYHLWNGLRDVINNTDDTPDD